jgi:hypothetical protein
VRSVATADGGGSDKQQASNRCPHDGYACAPHCRIRPRLFAQSNLTSEAMRKAERELALQAQRAYERTVSDWQAKRPAKAGAGATNGRASSGSSKDQVARQT